MLVTNQEIQCPDFRDYREITISNNTVAAATNLHSIIDENGCYKFISDSVTCFLGYDADEVIGKKAYDFIDNKDRRLFTESLQYLTGENTFTLPAIKLCCKNGKLKLVEVSITNLLGTEPINGILINYRDLSDIISADQVKNQVTSSHAAFFAKHPFGIFHIPVDGKVDRINPKLTEDLGYKLSDISEQPLMSFLLPQYRRKAFLMFYNAVNLMEPETCDVEVYTITGQPLHINFTIVPVVYENRTIEIYGVVKNISDRFELQESLKRSSIVADRSLNGVIIMDSNRKIEWVNKGFTIMNGYSLEESIGKDPSGLLRIEKVSQEIIDSVKETLTQGKSVKKEMLCYKKDNSAYWNFVEITPVLNRNGKLERIISFHTDISEKKKVEDDLKRFANDLYRQNKELHQFAYIVSHNLRSPVANVIGLAALLELYKDDPETLNTGLADLFKAANNIDSVIKDLSNILEITNGGSRGLIKEPVNVSELLKQIQTDLVDIIADSSAIIVIQDLPSYVQSNKAYLYSIFYNLISNAIKYKCELAPEIKIKCQCERDKIIFTVADNGIGIDLNKHCESIFKPYKRFNLNVEGKGLGLFLVKSHMEALGGEIEVESEPGTGTMFRFTLPS